MHESVRAHLDGGTVGGRGGRLKKMSIQRVGQRRSADNKGTGQSDFPSSSRPAQVSLPFRGLPLYSLSSINITDNKTVPYQPTPSAEDLPFRSAIPPAAAVFISPQPKEYEVLVHRAAHLESELA